VRLLVLALLCAGCSGNRYRTLDVKVAPHAKATIKMSTGIASFFAGAGSAELDGGDTGSSVHFESGPGPCPVEPKAP
jgi:hypothetical protein